MERAEKRSKRIKWSAIAGLVSSGTVACVSFFSAPITINYLGKDLYGVWVIITSFLFWAQLFDFGILNGLTNALSEALGKDDYESARSYISTAFLITLLISSLGIVVWCAVSLHIPWSQWIKVDTVQQGILLKNGICIIGCLFLATLPFLLSQKILLSAQKLYIAHAISFIAYLLTLLALLIGVHSHFTLCQLLLIINGLPLIWHAFCCCVLMRKIPWARFSLYFVKLRALKRVAQSSLPLLLIQMIQIITSQMIPILIASVTTLKDVADFGILWKMYLFISLVTANVSLAHNPGFRDAYERGEIEWIKKALKRLAFFQGGLTLLGCLPLCIAGNKVIEVWINMPLEQPLKSSSWMVFTLCALFSVLNATLHSVLLILDKMRFQILLILFSSTALLLSILFGVSRIGLIAPFVAMGAAALLCMYFSFRSLKVLLNRRALRSSFQ